MNWDQIEGTWNSMKGKIRSQWGELTDDDLDQIRGNREKLEGEIQKKYGRTKEEVRKEVDDFLDKI